MIVSLRILRAAEQLQIPAAALGELYMLSGVRRPRGRGHGSTAASSGLGYGGSSPWSSVACGAGCGLLSVVGPEDCVEAGRSRGIPPGHRLRAHWDSRVALRSGLQLAELQEDLLGRVRGAGVIRLRVARGSSAASSPAALADSIGVANVIPASYHQPRRSVASASISFCKTELSPVQHETKSH